MYEKFIWKSRPNFGTLFTICENCLTSILMTQFYEPLNEKVLRWAFANLGHVPIVAIYIENS